MVKEGNKVALQPVEVGPVVGQNWLIREGLKAGERIVVEGFQKISAGIEVKPVDQTAPHESEAGKPHDPDEAESEARRQAASQVR